MNRTEFSILFLALRDSYRAGMTSLMDAQKGLESLCRLANQDYKIHFNMLIQKVRVW